METDLVLGLLCFFFLPCKSEISCLRSVILILRLFASVLKVRFEFADSLKDVPMRSCLLTYYFQMR